MRDEDDLRKLLAGAEAPGGLDANAVIARSRRRRLPRQLAAGGIGVLALAGVGVVAVNASLLAPVGSSGGADSAVMSEESGDLETMKQFGAIESLACGAAVDSVPAAASGLELTSTFPAVASVDDGTVPGRVAVTNTSTESVSGVLTTAPVAALAQAGVIVAVGSPEYTGTDVDLAGGESIDLAASLALTGCSSEPLAPGSYDIVVAVDFAPAGVIAAPTVAITLE
ncbi:hypothetical protein M2152_000715 [Microbacteriaceae bacterium SG_E_30_P1]|uniref:Uncharacterized protein n=1 Tax=Antiquaquibacter oligotrophicus TaxID=2880260 RepID=A0ABT6KM63_9MICO|nr:hypothetical protein [Antiquaquibacter oligotrophicus]MDH6180533.1 hypothetical protein [Antiquaquibacter oligotrophicus]UDF13733.1 hypothetical protein LH407_02440 [Antiquaquibacter oligotrophicus]